MSSRPRLTFGFRAPQRHGVDRLLLVAAESDVQEPAQRVEIGGPIESVRQRPGPVDGVVGGPLFRRHVIGRAAERQRHLLARGESGVGEMEVEQQRLAVGGEQDVRRLDVEMDEPAFVGVVERLGQARADPADGIDVRHAPQPGPGTAALGHRQRRPAAGAVERSISRCPVRRAAGVSARAARTRARLAPPK